MRSILRIGISIPDLILKSVAQRRVSKDGNKHGGRNYSAGCAGARPLVRQRLAQPGLNFMPVSLSNHM